MKMIGCRDIVDPQMGANKNECLNCLSFFLKKHVSKSPIKKAKPSLKAVHKGVEDYASERKKPRIFKKIRGLSLKTIFSGLVSTISH